MHLDVRKDHSAFWIDYSGPGERAMYSSNPADDLKSGRAEKYHPSKIDESWLDTNPPQGQPQPQPEAAPVEAPVGAVAPDPTAPAPSEQPPATPLRAPTLSLRLRDAAPSTNKRPFVLVFSAPRESGARPTPTTHPRRILCGHSEDFCSRSDSARG